MSQDPQTPLRVWTRTGMGPTPALLHRFHQVRTISILLPRNITCLYPPRLFPLRRSAPMATTVLGARLTAQDLQIGRNLGRRTGRRLSLVLTLKQPTPTLLLKGPWSDIVSLLRMRWSPRRTRIAWNCSPSSSSTSPDFAETATRRPLMPWPAILWI